MSSKYRDYIFKFMENHLIIFNQILEISEYFTLRKQFYVLYLIISIPYSLLK